MDEPGPGSSGSRRVGTWMAVVSALAIAAALQYVGAPLVGPDSPWGIVSLQFVVEHARAVGIVDGWGGEGRNIAVRHLLIDLAFPFAYVAALASLAHDVAERASGSASARARARVVVIAAAVAGAADLVENGAMLATVTGRGGPWSTRLTVAMAVPKFALLGVALVTLALSALVAMRDAPWSRFSRGPAD